MEPATQVWDKYIYSIVFGWIPFCLLITTDVALIYKVKDWTKKKMISPPPDRFFKDGRSNKTIIAIGIIAIFLLLPNVILKAAHMVTRNAETYQDLPICFHRALNASAGMLYSPGVELFATILGVTNSTIKFFLYMGLHKQFRYTFVYYSTKPFKKSTGQQPLKNYMGISSSVDKLDAQNRNHHISSSSESQLNNQHSGAERPYIVSASHPPPYLPRRYKGPSKSADILKHSSSGNVPDIVYYEDQFGSRRILPPAPSVELYKTPPMKYHKRKPELYPAYAFYDPPGGQQSYHASEPDLIWEEKKFERFCVPCSSSNSGGNEDQRGVLEITE